MASSSSCVIQITDKLKSLGENKTNKLKKEAINNLFYKKRTLK
jgi:hypothetical protein